MNNVSILENEKEDLINFFQTLEDDDDVQNFFFQMLNLSNKMLIIGIDPGISGSICFLQDGKIIEVLEMPTMTDGKKIKNKLMEHRFITKFLKE